MSDSVPLLFDTDIGSDIDDAVALAYLLREPRCELLGITTVTGEPIERARLADAVCRAAGRTEIPIHAGVDEPFLIPLKQTAAPQKAVLERWPHRREFEPYTAVSFLQQTIRSRPGEITLLAVGPFTNIGALFALDPEIPSLLKRLVVMGGVFTTAIPRAPRCEWNVIGDPHAAARMFRAHVAEVHAFGLDVTLRCTMPAEECRNRFQGGALDVVREMAEVWFGHRPDIVFHDPLAAVGTFHPDICRYQEGRIEVELQSERVAGMTHWHAATDGPHRIAVGVDADRFFEQYFSIATGHGAPDAV
jgi:purine nucleosidase